MSAMAELKQPRTCTAGGLQQLRYQVPYDVTSSAIYPLISSNGSTVIVNGHSTGLSIIWRGGRRLKPSKTMSLPDPTLAQDVMTIDDSDDERSNAQDTTPPDFEDEEEGFDPRHPYPAIVQTLDLPLGTGVLHLAIPSLSEAERRHLEPKLLRDKILVATACTDGSLRVLIIPLDPPSDVSKARKSLVQNPSVAVAGNGRWGEQVVEVPMSLGHKTLPTAVSITVTPRYLTVNRDDTTMEDAAEQGIEWDVLLASGSADVGGTLLVHRFPVEDDGLRLSNHKPELWRNVLLETFPTSIDIFGGSDLTSASYPRVVVAQAERLVRIYECSSDDTELEGRWTATLRASSGPVRRMLAVQFGLAGRVVLGLTRDGEYGVWDVSELPGGIEKDAEATLSRFDHGGTLASSLLASTKQASTSRQTQFKALPAVTPHTHKVRQQDLFSKGGQGTGASPATSLRSFHGGITLTKTTHTSGSGEDSSVLIWYNDRVIFIQSLRAYHVSRRAAHGSDSSSALIAVDDPFNSTSNAGAQVKHMTVPDRSNLNGGIQVAVYPVLSSATRGPSFRNRAPEAVYISERAVSFVGLPRTDNGEVQGQADITQTSSNAGSRSDFVSGLSGLLKRGEVSLEGVEGMLDRMAGSVRRLSGRT